MVSEPKNGSEPSKESSEIIKVKLLVQKGRQGITMLGMVSMEGMEEQRTRSWIVVNWVQSLVPICKDQDLLLLLQILPHLLLLLLQLVQILLR